MIPLRSGTNTPGKRIRLRGVKDKGKRFELELVKLARAYDLKSDRAWGSDGRSLGLAKEVDLVVNRWKIQAKRRGKLPSYLVIPEGADAVAFRMDRGETYIMMGYREFLDLVKREVEYDRCRLRDSD